ncbi:MAG: EutN/CcmL family microcompartment protein [Spirochaetota bacterium]
MQLARVIGTVTATQHINAYRQEKLLVVKPVNPDGSPAAGILVAMDRAQAGPGDTVLILDEGNSARIIVGDKTAPVRTMIVGIVDAVELQREPRGGSQRASGDST